MMLALALFLVASSPDAYTVRATAEREYVIERSRESLRDFMDDLGLFARHMPGVAGVEAMEEDRYLYRTEKRVPLAPALAIDFAIRKTVESDSLTVYRSVDSLAADWMECRVLFRPDGGERTPVRIDLTVRMTREDASDVHWLAPVVGRALIARQMSDDLRTMLDEFAAGSTAELHARIPRSPSAVVGGTP
jgi:hypothetical protein